MAVWLPDVSKIIYSSEREFSRECCFSTQHCFLNQNNVHDFIDWSIQAIILIVFYFSLNKTILNKCKCHLSGYFPCRTSTTLVWLKCLKHWTEGARRSRFCYQFCHWLGVRWQADQLVFLCLSLSICKTRIVPTSWGCNKAYLIFVKLFKILMHIARSCTVSAKLIYGEIAVGNWSLKTLNELRT